MPIFQYINQLSIIESIATILPYLIGWTLFTVILLHYDKKRFLQVVTLALLVFWIYATWRYTVFGRTAGIREFSLIPFAQLYQVIRFDDYELMMSAWFNILLFLPGGVLLPELLPATYEMRRRIKVVVVCAFAMSVMIEASQGIWGLGLVETDDVMCNTLGACVGYGCYWVKRRGVKRHEV